MLKPLAIYLPQFHPIPENDKAWGTGFTEWTNVKKAVPFFEGHYQPHIPHERVGYYDLRDPEVLVKQAAMAKEYGIYGFAFYHYWFNGKRLLNTPIDNMLNTEKPDFPFMLIWANENWTKRWDGMNNDIIVKQEYSPEDDIEHIIFLCKSFFKDRRYITIDEKPVFAVYRSELLPDIKLTSEIWRKEAKKLGFKDLFLIKVESFTAGIDPAEIGFDAAMEFAPDWRNSGEITNTIKSQVSYDTVEYPQTVINTLTKNCGTYKLFRSVFANWDNTPRKKHEGVVYSKCSPEIFEYYLSNIIAWTDKFLSNNEKFLFINAWNEWGEGCHIEPDQLNGFKYLEICRDNLNNNIIHRSEQYVHFLESTIIELNIKNKQFQFLDKQFHSINYKIGELILSPIRFIRKLYRGLRKKFIFFSNPIKILLL
jgi:lipopolysaccharide biosynthesis protein